MISKIIPWDVFSETRQIDESTIRITCGTNDVWQNDPEWNSVAWKIAKDYHSDFANLWHGALGQVHSRDFNLGNINAQAFAIVCNETLPWTWWNDPEKDWSQAVEAVKKGFDTIPDMIGNSMTSWNAVDNLRQGIQEIQWVNDFNLSMRVQEELDKFNNTINPIIRSVLIWSGVSGRTNDANVAGILQAMHESHANVHLYLDAEPIVAQVAKVIPLFPATYALQETPWYEDIRLVS